MGALTGLLNAVAEPSGLWAIIIKSFESGVGSYILAVLLLTVLIRVVWAPFETLNKKLNAKMTRNQAKVAPQLEKIKKQYANDPQMLNKKQQELYKKANAGLGGGCLFMLIFLILNLVIFGSMFTTMNAFSSYKINRQYESLKYDYANVLNLADTLENQGNLTPFIENYEDVKVEIVDGKINFAIGEIKSTAIEYKNSFTEDFEGGRISEKVITDDLIYRYITQVESVNYKGTITVREKTYNQAISTIANKFIDEQYQDIRKENSFLWIKNIWVADAPFKQSIFDFNEYKNSVGQANVQVEDEVIYNTFMTQIRDNYNGTNGYFILAIISIAATFLSILISSGKLRKKKENQMPQQNGKVMIFIMPLIMGLFAIFYNSVFAFYLVVSQIMSTALSPLESLIIKKWEAKDIKKEEDKVVVEYSRKK